jgi:putative nucleotidyltransferase with HDIG domain
MAQVNGINLQGLSQTGNVQNTKNKSYAYLLNEPIKDSVEFSSTKSTKTNSNNPLNLLSSFMSDAVRKFQISNTPERYMKKFLNEDYINQSVEAHRDEIESILGKYGYEPKVDMSHLEDSENHFMTTYNYATNLTREGGYKLSEDDRYTLQEAALLHDIGKALIPDEVFNKPGKFTPEEREVMDLHSELSYVLLKDSGVSDATLSAIRNHHHKEQTGDKITELLSLCDETSALKENRVYKKGFSDEKTSAILQEDASVGKLNKDIVKQGLDIMSPN